jgi:hypothetical protein
MPAKVSATLKALLEIRDAVRRTDSRLDALERTTAERFESLERVLVGELVANRTVMQDIATILRDGRVRYERRLDDHERRLRALERKTG